MKICQKGPINFSLRAAGKLPSSEQKMNADKSSDNIFYIAGWVLSVLAAILLAAGRCLGFQAGFFLPPCPLHALTGYYCPGCGGTRAVAALLDGAWLLSLRYHPLVLPAAAAFLWFMASQTAERVSRGRIAIGMHFREIYLWAALAILLANCLIKNLALFIWHVDLMPG